MVHFHNRLVVVHFDGCYVDLTLDGFEVAVGRDGKKRIDIIMRDSSLKIGLEREK